MFTTFTAATETAIQTTEQSIADLQQQLDKARQELAQLQQRQQAEETARSAAETAIQMVKKARRLVAVALGKDAVSEFDRALLADEVAGELSETPDPESQTANSEPTEVEPKDHVADTDTTTVTVVAETITDEPIAEQEEVGESQVESSTTTAEQIPTLPTPSAIGLMKKGTLIAHLKAHKLPIDGLTKTLKSRLTAFVLSKRPPQMKAA